MAPCPHRPSRRWVVPLLLAAGCGFDDQGFVGGGDGAANGGANGDGAAPVADMRLTVDAAADAPAPDTRVELADAGPCVPAACPVPANADPTCTGDRCGFSCRMGFRLVGDRCAANDTAACCGPACTLCPTIPHGLPQCRNQACDTVCETGFHREGAACVMDGNAACCGADCQKCGAPANAVPLCKAGTCAFTCNASFHPVGDTCAPNDQLGCCGPACESCQPTRANATAVCASTGCASPSPCLATHHDCNGLCVANDAVASCGAACTPCATRPNATVACSGGNCVYACAAGFADCDANANNGCEATVATDPANCGACSTGPLDPHRCAAGGSHPQTCNNGVCRCPDGWGDCNGDRNDGCEANFQTSNVHCGACNPKNPREIDLLTEQAYKAADADPACKVYKLETCVLGHCKGP